MSAPGLQERQDAQAALERALEKLRRRQGSGRMLTLAELLEQYLAGHEASPSTPEKLRWLLTRSIAAVGRRARIAADRRDSCSAISSSFL
jgi:hypothetical protein